MTVTISAVNNVMELISCAARQVLTAPVVHDSFMRIEQRASQRAGSLEDFYAGLVKDAKAYAAGSVAMLSLIASLRQHPDERVVWAVTSHERLCLMARDASGPPWPVIVSALDPRNYSIEYLMPEAIAPWPYARVTGEARSDEQALVMIRHAMDLSLAWA